MMSEDPWSEGFPPNFGAVRLRPGLAAAHGPRRCISSSKAARPLAIPRRKSCFIVSGRCFMKQSGVLVTAVPCVAGNR